MHTTYQCLSASAQEALLKTLLLLLLLLQVRYVLKNLVRDWSAEGALERQQSYGLLTEELKERFAGRCGMG